MATARLVVTLAGCIALVALAAIAGNEQARAQLVALLPAALPKLAVAEAESVIGLEQATAAEPAGPAVVPVDPRQKHVVRYLARRYRVADEAVQMLVQAAFEVGERRRLDPLLILSVIAIESSLNPFAASPVGAQGLMQVMTHVHSERFEPHGGNLAALDPIANIKVGSEILHELIRRGGSVERGLQLYVGAGNLPDDGGYAAKVLAERSRLEIAATGRVDAAIAAARAAVEPKPVAVVPADTTPAAPATPVSDAKPHVGESDQHT